MLSNRIHIVVASVVLFLTHSPTCEARPKYKTGFQRLYPKLVTTLGKKQTGCMVCHPNTEKSKKKRNDYGVAFTKKLGGTNVSDADKIKQALRQTEKEMNEDGELFGDRIRAGKLPGKNKAFN